MNDDEFWPDLSGYPGVGEGRILVSNNLDDTLSVLDLALVGTDQLAVMARVPLGFIPVEREGPHHVAEDASGEYYYVGMSNFVPASGSGPHGVHGAGTADGHVLKMRASDNAQVASVRVDRNPGDAVLTPSGDRLLVSHFDLLRIREVIEAGGEPSEMRSKLAVIDPETMTRQAMIDLCPAAHGIVVSADGAVAYVSCLDDRLAVVDLDDFAVTLVPVLERPGSVVAPACYPYALTMSPDGGTVWVSCYQSGQVLAYDVGSRAMDSARSVQLPGPAAFGSFTPDGAQLVMPYQALSGLAFIEPSSGEPLEILTLPEDLCTSAHVVRFTDEGRYLLTLCEGNHVDPGTLLVLESGSHEVQHSVRLGVFPDDLAILRGP